MTNEEAVLGVERFHKLEARFAETKALQEASNTKKPEFSIENMLDLSFIFTNTNSEEEDEE